MLISYLCTCILRMFAFSLAFSLDSWSRQRPRVKQKDCALLDAFPVMITKPTLHSAMDDIAHLTYSNMLC